MQTKQIDHVLGKPYSVPRERSRWPSLGLALAMHLGLLFFLWVGVHWQNTEPVAVEAEVWDLKVQTAAPPPEVATEPEPTPAPPLEPEVERPAPPPPPPVAAPEPKVDLREAEIALERKKAKLKEEKDKAAAEERRKQEQKEREEEKRELEKQKQKEKDKAEKLEKEKADKLEKAKLEKEKEKAQEKAEKELADKKAAAEKAAKAKKAAEEKKAADKARAAEMSRITGAAGAGTTGTAEKSTAPRKDSGYVAALTSKIKSNIAYSGSTDVPGNPRAVFKIEQLPTGEIISVRKIKSSGLPAYDSSVENAINKSSPLPKKKDGTVEREIELIFEMKDLPK
ncbi:cell envelope integrity protein TolA [Janthinobacterium sp. SUN118]|uniref:cell envelope integrity protein TolA n=1 Tax=Janthinobacterium sp. SUN118 TaxID=3004100 RepID=UPI0025B034FC|nr:cell envelope integrity protein TolA [Janthinobacterium sp. SUN118]MDN2712716.1 cell envelope integrity protein TolA [Janthinobacterium sp. SUN118]